MQLAAQHELDFPAPRTWGGFRKGAGRPKRESGAPHARRSRVSTHDPRLVTIKRAKGLPALRTERAGHVIVEAIKRASKPAFRIVHFTIQVDHLHLIVEADDAESLAGGMKGLVCRLARGLNKAWQRTGKVFPQRFHDFALRSLCAVRNALLYVLNNHHKHGVGVRRAGWRRRPDEFSSGKYFDGWIDFEQEYSPEQEGAYVAKGGWKLTVGWRTRYPLIGIDERPGKSPASLRIRVA